MLHVYLVRETQSIQKRKISISITTYHNQINLNCVTFVLSLHFDREHGTVIQKTGFQTNCFVELLSYRLNPAEHASINYKAARVGLTDTKLLYHDFIVCDSLLQQLIIFLKIFLFMYLIKACSTRGSLTTNTQRCTSDNSHIIILIRKRMVSAQLGVIGQCNPKLFFKNNQKSSDQSFYQIRKKET